MTYGESFERVVGKEKISVEKIVVFILAVVLGIIGAVYGYRISDYIPATFDDYLPLNNQLLAVQGKPEEFMKVDCDIKIRNGLVTYTVENEECSMTGRYNESLQLIETSQKDKADDIASVICGCVFFFMLIVVLSYLVLILIVFLAEILVITVLKIIRKIKGKKEESA